MNMYLCKKVQLKMKTQWRANTYQLQFKTKTLCATDHSS